MSGDEFDDHYETQRRRNPSARPPTAPAAASVQWVDDAQAPTCHVCDASFSLVKRRHHCRTCGNVICSSCSVFVPTATKPQRVCITCVEGVPVQTKARAKPAKDRNQRPVEALRKDDPKPPTHLAPVQSSHRLQESIDNWFLDESEGDSPVAARVASAMPAPTRASASSTPAKPSVPSNPWANVGASARLIKTNGAATTVRYADVVFDDRPLYDDDDSQLTRFPAPPRQAQHVEVVPSRGQSKHRSSMPSAAMRPSAQPLGDSLAPSLPPPVVVAPAPPPPVPTPEPQQTKKVEKKHGFRATIKRFFGGSTPPEAPASTAIVPAPPGDSVPSSSPSSMSASMVSSASDLQSASASWKEEPPRTSLWVRGASDAASAYDNPSLLSARHAPLTEPPVRPPAAETNAATRSRRDTFDEMFEGPRVVQPPRELQARTFDVPSLVQPHATRDDRRDTLDDIVFGDRAPVAPVAAYGGYTSLYGASRFGPDRFAQAPPAPASLPAARSANQWASAPTLLDDDDKRQEAEFDPATGSYVVPQRALALVQAVPDSYATAPGEAVAGAAMSEKVGIAIVDKLSSLEHELAELKSLLAGRKSHRRSNAASIFEQASDDDSPPPTTPLKKQPKKKPAAPRKDSFDDLFRDDQKADKYEALFAVGSRDSDEDEVEADKPQRARWPGRAARHQERLVAPAPTKPSNRRFTMDDSDSAPEAPSRAKPKTKGKRRDSFQDLFKDDKAYSEDLMGYGDSSEDDTRGEKGLSEMPLPRGRGSKTDTAPTVQTDEELPSLRRSQRPVIEPPATSKPAKATTQPRSRKDSIDALFHDDEGKFDSLFEDKPAPAKPSTKNLFEGSSDDDNEDTSPTPKRAAVAVVASPYVEDAEEEELPSLRSAGRRITKAVSSKSPAPVVDVYVEGTEEDELPSLRGTGRRLASAATSSDLPASVVSPEDKTDSDVANLEHHSHLEAVASPVDVSPAKEIGDLYVEGGDELELPSLRSFVHADSGLLAASDSSAPVDLFSGFQANAPPTLPSQSSGFAIDLYEEFDSGLFGAATVSVRPTAVESEAPSASWLYDAAASSPSIVDDSDDSALAALGPPSTVTLVELAVGPPSLSAATTNDAVMDEASYVRVEVTDAPSLPEMIPSAADSLAELPGLKETTPFDDLFAGPTGLETAADADGDSDNDADEGDDISFESKPTKRRQPAVAPTIVSRVSVHAGEDGGESIMLGGAPAVVDTTLEAPTDLAKLDDAEFDASWQTLQLEDKTRKQNVMKRQRQLQKQKQKEKKEQSEKRATEKPKTKKKHTTK
ncbi:hypothetical protein ACHHYP_06080 [Achlya hypogyna]|uniref:FYVE-type domain-containing protein n=1 Tax=Achlya hypogyna TaxID=1202772 RepID=A0A1V9YVV1_ACHHY|nr:hypothetical protein ACHHYP_06080 [Achlya hypogyna]